MMFSIVISKESLIKYDYILVTINHSVYYVNLLATPIGISHGVNAPCEKTEVI
jgi:hypothetical protein